MFEVSQRVGLPGPERVGVEMGVSEEQAGVASSTADAAAASVVGIEGSVAGSSVSVAAAVFEVVERESVHGYWPPLWPLEDLHILGVALAEAPSLEVVLQTGERAEEEQVYEYHLDEKQHYKFESSPSEHLYLRDLSEIAR